MAHLIEMMSSTVRDIDAEKSERDQGESRKEEGGRMNNHTVTRNQYRYKDCRVDDDDGSDSPAARRKCSTRWEPVDGAGKEKKKDKEEHEDADEGADVKLSAHLQVSAGSLALLSLTGRILRAEQRILALRRLYHQVFVAIHGGHDCIVCG
jgi:hypothetical protein